MKNQHDFGEAEAILANLGHIAQALCRRFPQADQLKKERLRWVFNEVRSGKTFAQLGREIPLSRERVRHLYNQAARKDEAGFLFPKHDII